MQTAVCYTTVPVTEQVTKCFSRRHYMSALGVTPKAPWSHAVTAAQGLALGLNPKPNPTLPPGHHMLPVATGCLDSATADRLLKDCIALHDDHERDAGDTLMMAYDHGTYTKVCAAATCSAPFLLQVRVTASR